jgi:hypothetical protein
VTTSRKAIISLLIAVLLFGVFSVLAFSGLFSLLEARFYNPSVTEHLNRDNARNAGAIDRFFTEMRERFSETLRTDTVRHSFLTYQRAEDVSARANIFSRLIESFYGVQWVRFIDTGGQRLLFSSYGPDILSGDGTFPVYRDYNEPGLPYEVVAVAEDGPPKYTFDERAGRIIFSFPLYDSFDIYWGTALFALSVDAVTARLVNEGRLKPGEDITVISNPAGLLFGAAPGLDRSMIRISTRTSQGFLVGRLAGEEVFLLPSSMKIILLLAFFLTSYLIIFLLFNLRQDPLVVVQNRLKQLQISLIEQFYERKSEADWERWIKELENRREEVRGLLKRGVKADSDKSTDMDILIDKSWDELLLMLGSRRNLSTPGETDIDEEKIAQVLQKLLEAARTGASSAIAADDKAGLVNTAAPITAESEKTESAEEIEILEELDEVEIADENISESAPLPVSQTNIDKLATQIEFSHDIEPETSDDDLFGGELEIVSPFSAMVFDSTPERSSEERGSNEDDAITSGAEETASDENRSENGDAELGINAVGINAVGINTVTTATEGLPLITTPFSSFSNNAGIEILQTVNGEDESQTDGDGNIIKEKEGVHYISDDVLAPSPEVSASLDAGFKELVDDVTK